VEIRCACASVVVGGGEGGGGDAEGGGDTGWWSSSSQLPPRKNYFGCELFFERGTSPSTGQFSKSFIDSKLFSKTFNTSKLFSRTFNTSKIFFATFMKCRVLKLQALARTNNGTRGNSGNLYASGTTHT
ncbi:hypothetical protein Tco_0999914, partial [Tanacetum coccineum]